MPGKCVFNERWFENSFLKLWLEHDTDKYKAKCKVCMKTFDVSKMGKSALASHEKGKKHINLMEKQRSSTTGDIRNLLSNSSSTASQPATGRTTLDQPHPHQVMAEVYQQVCQH